jgi:phage terminase large subunit
LAEPISLEVECPDKLKFFGLSEARYKGAKGGRGGGKSWAIADILLLKSIEKRRRILCGREFQNTIADSVHQILIDRIAHYKLDKLFDITDKEINCIQTGSFFIFKGLHYNITEIKSLEGIDIFWGEEAEKFSQKSLDIITPTIRMPGSELWFSWNTSAGDEPVEQLFKKRKNSILVHVDYRDNPWFPQVLRDEMEHDKANNEPRYKHVWLGEEGGTGRFFPEFSKNAELMKLEPKKFLPYELNLYGSMDYGDGGNETSGATSFGLWNLDKKTGKPVRLFTYYRRNMFADAYAREIVSMIRSFWFTDGMMPRVVYADPSIFVKRSGINGTTRAIADYFKDVGLNMVEANNNRVNGWRVVRNAFSLDVEGQPNSYFWNSYNDEYEYFIPKLNQKESNPEDAEKGGDQEHLCDDVRYGLVAFMSGVKTIDHTKDQQNKNAPMQRVWGLNEVLKPRMLSLQECY